jgi:hypothetical protein
MCLSPHKGVVFLNAREGWSVTRVVWMATAHPSRGWACPGRWETALTEPVAAPARCHTSRALMVLAVQTPADLGQSAITTGLGATGVSCRSCSPGCRALRT